MTFNIMAERSTCREILVTHLAAGTLGCGIGGAVLREGMQTEKPALIAIGAVTTVASAAMTGVGILRRPRPEDAAPVGALPPLEVPLVEVLPITPITPELLPNSADL